MVRAIAVTKYSAFESASFQDDARCKTAKPNMRMIKIRANFRAVNLGGIGDFVPDEMDASRVNEGYAPSMATSGSEQPAIALSPSQLEQPKKTIRPCRRYVQLGFSDKLYRLHFL